jgi:hypothetical protein
MNSTKLKTVFLGLSCFAFACAFAQDSPKTPKPDTTKRTRHDSTSISGAVMHGSSAGYSVKMLNASFTKNEDIVALKKEAEDEILTIKSFAKISS